MSRQILIVAGLLMHLSWGVSAIADVWEVEIPGEVGTYPFEFPSSEATIDSVSISMTGTWVPAIYCCKEDHNGNCTGTWSAGINVDVLVVDRSFLVFENGERFDTTNVVIDETKLCYQNCQWFPDGSGELKIIFDYADVYHAQAGCPGTIQDASVVVDSPVSITFYYSNSVAIHESSWGLLKSTYR
ncbi:MAG: hypothetical protein ACI9ON_004331 [Limisphaerales bacterium]|jgi:hypothetical protein